MKKKLLWFWETYQWIMDYKYNPLKYIPSLHLQIWFTMVLASGWAVAFGLMIGNLFSAYPSAIGHMVVIAMVFITAATFMDAERDQKEWLKKWRAEVNDSK